MADIYINSSTFIGTVRDVNGASVSISLQNNHCSGLVFVNGQGYRIGQIGSFVKIPIGYLDLFGIVSQVGASAVPEKMAAIMPNGDRWMTVQLIGECYKSERFQRGISQYPTIDDAVHLVSDNDLYAIYGGLNDKNHFVRIGNIVGSESIDALININKLVTRHSAVVGTTGAGKSTTVAGILNVLSDCNRFPSARILILDIHGEYAHAFKDRANVFRVNPDTNSDNSSEKKLCIPFWALNFDEFIRVAFGALPSEGKSRSIILEKVLDAKKNTLKKYPITGFSPDTITVDSPVPFSLNELWYELYCTEFGTYYSGASKTPEPKNWAYEQDENGKDIKGCAELGIPPRFRRHKNVKDDPEKIQMLPDSLNLRSQLEALGAKLRTSRYNFILRAGDWHPDSTGCTQRTLAELMEGWIGSDKPITIFDLSGIPSIMTNDIIGSLLRIIYEGLFWARNQSEGGRERPLLIVMEEAHTYLNDNFDGVASIMTQRIVKEGRKYGIGAMIVSQRPSEINSTILSQCGTFFTMRLSNSSDRSKVATLLPDNLDSLTNMLPILRTGEAIILGEAVQMPTRVMIQSPPINQRPDSQDPIVCDEMSPDVSTCVGGWTISGEVRQNHKSERNYYDTFVTTWLSQNPRIYLSNNNSTAKEKGEIMEPKIINNFDSTSIESFKYYEDQKILEVKFQTGSVYQYYDVPLEEINELEAADSKGSYLNNSIKGHYRYSKV